MQSLDFAYGTCTDHDRCKLNHMQLDDPFTLQVHGSDLINISKALQDAELLPNEDGQARKATRATCSSASLFAPDAACSDIP